MPGPLPGLEDSVEKCRAVGQSLTPKHRSPERLDRKRSDARRSLVRGVPTAAWFADEKAPNKLVLFHATSLDFWVGDAAPSIPPYLGVYRVLSHEIWDKVQG